MNLDSQSNKAMSEVSLFILCLHTLFFLFYVSYLPCIFVGMCVVLILLSKSHLYLPYILLNHPLTASTVKHKVELTIDVLQTVMFFYPILEVYIMQYNHFGYINGLDFLFYVI